MISIMLLVIIIAVGFLTLTMVFALLGDMKTGITLTVMIFIIPTVVQFIAHSVYDEGTLVRYAFIISVGACFLGYYLAYRFKTWKAGADND